MKSKKEAIEFVGTRGEACSAFFKQLALSSEDMEQRKYYESLESFYREEQGHSKGRRFKATITNVN